MFLTVVLQQYSGPRPATLVTTAVLAETAVAGHKAFVAKAPNAASRACRNTIYGGIVEKP